MKLHVNGLDIEFQFTKNERLSCSHQGDCYDDCKAIVEKHPVLFSRITIGLAYKILKCTGGWTQEELEGETIQELLIKVVWIAAGNANDENSSWGVVSGY